MVTELNDASVAQEHLRRVQAVTDTALAHLSVEALLDELLLRIRELLRADTTAVLLIDDRTRELVATAAKGIEEEVEQGFRLPVGEGFAGRIAATAKPVVLEEVDHSKVRNPLLLRRGIRSMLGVPLIVDGRVIGVLHVGMLHLRKFTNADVELLQLVADRMAFAVQARRQHEQRVIAETLQRSLLPDRFPRVAGIEIAGRYEPAEGGMVGGDWYDVFVLGSGALCVVVGDVAGRGMPAAIAMARLRNTVRAIAFIDEQPADIVTRTNNFMLHFEPGTMATLVVGILGADGTLRYASAGHMPPVLVDPKGRAMLAEEQGEPPLGGFGYTDYRERHLQLDPGSTLILYTDGLVERRGRPLDDGLDALRRATEAPWSNLEMLCGRLFDAEDARHLGDDLAILALRVSSTRAFDEIHATIDADPRELAPLRRSLRRWLVRVGADAQETQDVLVAVGEATANAIEHAHGPGKGSVHVDAVARQNLVEVTVSDQGSWREPRGTHRGLGRSLMSALMDDVAFDSRENGTVVIMRKRLGVLP